MKNILFFILLFPYVSFCQLPSNGLVGYWSFQGNSIDQTSNNLNGVLQGATESTDRFGNPSEAYSFVGSSNQYIEIDNSITPLSFIHKTHNFSVSIYFKIDDLSHENVLMSNAYSTLHNGFIVNIKNGAPQFVSWYGISGQKNKLISNQVINDNDWHHLAVVADGTTLSMFLDNVAVGTLTSLVNSTTDAADDVHFGIYKSGGSYYAPSSLSGALDDIRIYDRVLTSSEIQLLAEESNPVTGNSLWSQHTNNIYYNGKVAINTETVPSGYDLAVNGHAIMEEIVVQLKQEWPDYVFDPSYNLPSLLETKRFIMENKHLKGIPSAAEVEEKGISLGEMNAKLLEKIEELTLYQIQMMELSNQMMEILQKQQLEINELKDKKSSN